MLDAQPVSDVVFTVTSSDTGEATVDKATLTFTNANWNTAQTVTVTGVDDATLVDGTQAVTITVSVDDAHSDDAFDPLADQTVSASNTDNDTAGYTVTGSPTSTSETGTTDTFTVVLDAQPVSDVVFTVTSSDTGEATVDKATLTFTNANWNTAQTVTVTGVDDATLVDGTQAVTITVSVDDAHSDDAFDPLADQTVSASNTDNDTAGYTVTGSPTSTSETGTTDTFTVVLDAQPVSDVVFTVTSSDTGEATVDKATLTFTNANWNTAQTVTVTGVDDATLVDGTQAVTITVSVDDAHSDDAFDPLADQTVSASNTDNDTAGYTVTGSPTSTSETGTTDTFTVVLDAQPVSDVVFTVTSSDTGEATVDKATLTFTNANWNTAQTVTVTGVDDAYNDGGEETTITISVDDAHSDDAFDPLADQTVTNTNSDDDNGVVAPKTSFEDLAGLSDEAVASIEVLVDLGVTSGTSETEFSPAEIVSRWEMALFISRTLDVTAFGPVDGASSSFEDIGGFSAEVQQAVDTLSGAGITNGITETEFDPSGSVTRWQMAIFLTRLLEVSGVSLPDATGDVPFSDLGGYSTEAQEAIEQLYSTGISAGTSVSTYSPGDSLPRWQMAIFLARVIEQIDG